MVTFDAADPGTCLRLDNIFLFRRGLLTILVGTLLAIGLAYGLLVGISTFDTEVLSRSKPTLLDLGIAVAAGSISGYAR